MASISKHAGSPYWYAFFRAGGHAIRKRIEPKIEVNPSLPPGASMKERKRLEAENRAKAIKIALELESVARLASRDAPEQRLRAIMADIVEKSGAKPASIGSIRFLYDEWKERALKQGANPKTIENYQSRINRFLDWLGSKADRPADSLTLAETQEFYDIRAREIHPTTLKKESEVLAMAFSAGIKKGRLIFNPWAGIEKVKQLRKKGRGSRTAFTEEQVKRLVQVADPEMGDMIYLQAHHGLRLGDASRLKWDSVDFAGLDGKGLLCFIPEKDPNQAPHFVPMHPKVFALLKRRKCKSQKAEPYVFPSLARRKISGNQGLSLMFKRVMKRAGIEPEYQKPKGSGAKRVSLLSNHSLRYFCAQKGDEEGMSIEDRMAMIGHSNKDIHRGYSAPRMEKLHREISRWKGLPLPSR